MEKNIENINNNKNKERRIGTFTFGLILILSGICIVISTFSSIDMLKYVLMLSPFIFISIGIEVIKYSRNNIKYDILGIFLTFITLGAGWIFCGINYGVNKLLYNNKVKNSISNNVSEQDFKCYFDNKVNIVNISDKNIDLQINELEDYTSTIVYIKYKYKINNDEEYYLSRIIEGNNHDNKREIDYDENRIIFINNDKECESIEVKILTNNKDNVKIDGKFNTK